MTTYEQIVRDVASDFAQSANECLGSALLAGAPEDFDQDAAWDVARWLETDANATWSPDPRHARMAHEIRRRVLVARLAELTVNDLEVVHCSGGDSQLPAHLRGTTPDVPHLPVVSACLALGGDTADEAICRAAEVLLPVDHPAYTDDLAVHLLA